MADNTNQTTTTTPQQTPPVAPAPAPAAAAPAATVKAAVPEQPKKRKVMRAIPTGTTSEEKAEAAHLRASRWAAAGAPQSELLAGRVYELNADVAAFLVARKGWSYVGDDGRPTDEKATYYAPKEIRGGTKEWLELEPANRVGSEEWRAAQMQAKLEQSATQ